MPASWGFTEILMAAFLLGIPAFMVIRAGRVWLRDIATARRLRRAEQEREATRRPSPGSVSLEGTVTSVVPDARPPVLVVRRKYGCLGGPIVFEVPPLAIKGDDGGLQLVELGPDPMVHAYQLLPSAVGDCPTNGPVPTGVPDAILRIVGRVRVEGLNAVGQGRWAPPAGYSATLTLLREEP